MVRKTQRNEKKKLSFSLRDIFRSSILSAAAAVLLCGGGALAQSTASNPTPPLNGDFLITPTPILTPWMNGASASEGSTSDIGASVTRLTYGPCVYRGAHWHNFAWEVLTPVTPGVRSCFMWFCFSFWARKT